MSTPHDPSQPDNRRFKIIPVENLTPDQKAVYDAIRSGPRSQLKSSAAAGSGPLGGPFNVMMRSPGMGMIIQRLGEEIRFRTSLPTQLNEMCILITGRHYTAQYEFYAHRKVALEYGLDSAIVDAIANGKRPEKLTDDEAIVYDFSTQLHKNHAVDDATYRRALDRFGERGIMDMIAVNGFYCLVSFMLNVDGTPLPAGEKPPLPILK
jgi:4-carboxymuconolactone decarboxylase